MKWYWWPFMGIFWISTWCHIRRRGVKGLPGFCKYISHWRWLYVVHATFGANIGTNLCSPGIQHLHSMGRMNRKKNKIKHKCMVKHSVSDYDVTETNGQHGPDQFWKKKPLDCLSRCLCYSHFDHKIPSEKNIQYIIYWPFWKEMTGKSQKTATLYPFCTLNDLTCFYLTQKK